MRAWDAEMNTPIEELSISDMNTKGPVTIALESFSEYEEIRKWVIEHLALPESLLRETLPQYDVDWENSVMVLKIRDGIIESVCMQ
jgi:hypothetical protein